MLAVGDKELKAKLVEYRKEMVEEALEMLTEKPEEGQHALICE